MRRNCRTWTALCMALSLQSGYAVADDQGVGDVVTGLLAIGTVSATYAYDDPEGRRMLIKSTLISYTANGLLRLAFNDTGVGTRPNGKGYGFPSGHAGFMAAGASFLQERYGWKLGLPAYLATGYVSYIRVEKTNHHRWEDIAAGVVLAHGVALWIVDPYESGVSVVPLLEPEASGVRLVYKW